MRETKFFGSYLELTRKITVYMDRPTILIEDVVENIGYRESPIMILYHFNFSYPVLDKNAKVLHGKTKIFPSDDGSKKGLDKYNRFSDPVLGFAPQVFYHDIEADKEGNSNIALVNPDFNNGNGIGLWIKYNKNNLPYLVQFKSMANGEYGCSLEPANSFVRGRKTEREEGNLRFIKPGEKINYKLEINILKSNKDIKKISDNFCI